MIFSCRVPPASADAEISLRCSGYAALQYDEYRAHDRHVNAKIVHCTINGPAGPGNGTG
jgi:hypothetical protein